LGGETSLLTLVEMLVKANPQYAPHLLSLPTTGAWRVANLYARTAVSG
jgi:hypothetical protein